MSKTRITHSIILSVCVAGALLFCAPSSQKALSSRADLRAAARTTEDNSIEIDQETMKTSVSLSTVTSIAQSFQINFLAGGRYFTSVGLKSNYVGLIPDDSIGFFEYYDNEFAVMTVEERAEITAAAKAGTYETPYWDSSVYSFKSTEVNYIFPEKIDRNGIFGFNVTSITLTLLNATSWTKAKTKTITIPATVNQISADAFRGIREDIVFNVEKEEGFDGYEEGWNHGCTVNYGYDYQSKVTAANKKLDCGNYSSFGFDAVNYYFGDYENDLPLVLTYNSYFGDSEVPVYKEFSAKKPSANGVGKLIGSPSVSLIFDIPLEEGEIIDVESINVQNLKKVAVIEEEDGSAHLDPDKKFDEGVYFTSPANSVKKTLFLEDFIDVGFGSVTSLAGYTNVVANMSVANPDIYKELNGSYYNRYLSLIKNGTISVRFRITSISGSTLKFIDKDNGVDVYKISSPVEYIKISQTSTTKFGVLVNNNKLAKQINPNNISAISITSLYVTVDLFAENGPVARSGYTVRFGDVLILPNTQSFDVFDANVLVSLVAAIYAIGFAAAAVIIYFVLKNKYKNDEFRRMRTKPYIIKSVLGLLGSLVVVLEGLFIGLRFSTFHNAVVGFNPADVFIIVFGIISVLAIGYFIRYVYLAIKAEMARRKAIKLRINEDVEDDGTK